MAPRRKKVVGVNLSLDTADRLEQYVYENHTTKTQVITDWIWSLKLKSDKQNNQHSIDSNELQKIGG